jgi:hypothetical protein
MGTKQAEFSGRSGLVGALVVALLGVLSHGCVTSIEEVARTRAVYDLQCNDLIRVEPRFGGDTYVVAGCGRRTFYTCTYARGSLSPTCVPEPTPHVETTQ